jgi:hypothetical protein
MLTAPSTSVSRLHARRAFVACNRDPILRNKGERLTVACGAGLSTCGSAKLDRMLHNDARLYDTLTKMTLKFWKRDGLLSDHDTVVRSLILEDLIGYPSDCCGVCMGHGQTILMRWW